MRSRATEIAVLTAFFAIGPASACGGRTAGLFGEDGLDDGGPPATGGSSGGGSTAGGGSSSGTASSSGDQGGSSSSGGVVGASSSSGSSGGPGCGPDLFSYGASSSLECWSCLEKGCAMQMTACDADCGCNDLMVKSLSCVNGGGSAVGCFTQAFGVQSDPTISAMTQCLVSVGTDCGCGTERDASPPPPNACVQTGGGSSGGGGQCSATFSETCGPKQYQIVCACPQARCVCFGDTTTVVPFDGCPYCLGSTGALGTTGETDALYTACGFPH